MKGTTVEKLEQAMNKPTKEQVLQMAIDRRRRCRKIWKIGWNHEKLAKACGLPVTCDEKDLACQIEHDAADIADAYIDELEEQYVDIPPTKEELRDWEECDRADKARKE